jgi:ligand-binding SRPBCC domain-containing protein
VERAFTVASVVAAPPDVVWARVASMAGVNDELWPLLRMTHPAGMDRLDAQPIAMGERLFRSWLLLFGLLPVDYDDLAFEAVEPGRGFRERSVLASQRVWRHERTLEPVAGGTRVTDRLAFVARLPGTGALYGAILAAVFRHRHRRLRRAFAGR